MAKKTETPVNATINITALHRPIAEKSTDRKVWSISLGNTWLPYFMATNAAGVTSVPQDVLGAPLRLARERDGAPRFSQAARPIADLPANKVVLQIRLEAKIKLLM